MKQAYWNHWRLAASVFFRYNSKKYYIFESLEKTYITKNIINLHLCILYVCTLSLEININVLDSHILLFIYFLRYNGSDTDTLQVKGWRLEWDEISLLLCAYGISRVDGPVAKFKEENMIPQFCSLLVQYTKPRVMPFFSWTCKDSQTSSF